MLRRGDVRLARAAIVVALGVWIFALCRDARAEAPAPGAPQGALHGNWVLAPEPLTPAAARTSTDALPTLPSLDRIGGPYWFVAAVTVGVPGPYVLDFGSSSTIGRFRHVVLDAEGKLVADVRGGIESTEPNPFFLRHGREVELQPGTYRVITELSSPFLLAEPHPTIAPLDDYRQSIKVSNGLVLLCLGIFVALGVYYAALGGARRRAADALYAGFVLGNTLYNGSALLVFSDLFGMHWFYLVSAPILVSNGLYVLFVMKLLDIEPIAHRGLARAGQGILGLMGLFILIALVRPRWSLELDRIGVAFFATYGLVCAIVRSRQGNISARFYLVAIATLFVLGGSAISLTKTDASYFFVEHLGLIAVTAEAVLLALVLAHQIAMADTERNTALDRAAHHARIARMDALTNLSNRYALELDLVELPLEGSLTFIDLDSLKRYNDEFGHARGDELLRGFARSLTLALGTRGSVYRLAGDEFAVTCPSGDETFVANAIAQSIQILKTQGFKFAGASHGSVLRSETASLEQLKQVADQRMYQQKHTRKSLGPKSSVA
jgi:diguanylate cyclase (GGDEF)-like protein